MGTKNEKIIPFGGLYLDSTQPTGEMRIPFRDSVCMKFDFCTEVETTYRHTGFHLAKNRFDFCELNKRQGFYTHDSNITVSMEHSEKLEDCMKRKSNIRRCPVKILEKINNELLTAMTKNLTDYKDSLKRKERRKRKRKSRKKKKKNRKKRRRRRRRQKGTSEEDEKKASRNSKSGSGEKSEERSKGRRRKRRRGNQQGCE